MSDPTLCGDALVVHLFVDVGSGLAEDAERFLTATWNRCRQEFGLDEQVLPELPPHPAPGTVRAAGPHALLAACVRPGSSASPLEEMWLRRVDGTVCLSIHRELPAGVGSGWAVLDADWTRVWDAVAPYRAGVVGVVRLYQARLAGPGAPEPDAALTAAVRLHAPPTGGGGYTAGVAVPAGFAVWEDVGDDDGRIERRIVVVAATDRDAEMSAWTWVGVDRELPRFARYLLQAARLRHQWRRWNERSYHQVQTSTGGAVDRILATVSTLPEDGELTQAALLATTANLSRLQAGQLALVVSGSRLRAMGQTVDATAKNLRDLRGIDELGGPFQDDAVLAGWLAQQLGDDLIGVEAARDQASEVGALADQLVQRGQQRRQERYGIGLTGVVGAILMCLTAVQALGYQVPLPPAVQPAAVATLGAVALVTSLIVLRLAVPHRRWPVALVWLGVGGVGAASGWTVAVASSGRAMTPADAWWPLVGFGVGVLVAAVAMRDGRRRRAVRRGSG